MEKSSEGEYSIAVVLAVAAVVVVVVGIRIGDVVALVTVHVVGEERKMGVVGKRESFAFVVVANIVGTAVVAV